MSLMNLGYLLYISQVKFHEKSWQKYLEVVNEFLLQIITYHFLVINKVLVTNEQYLRADGSL